MGTEGSNPSVSAENPPVKPGDFLLVLVAAFRRTASYRFSRASCT